MLATAFACVLVCLPSSPGTLPRVDVLGDASPGFSDSLRIQLTGVAAIELRPAPEGSTAGEQILSASRRVGAGAILAVWTQSMEAGAQVLFVVAKRDGAPIVELFRVPGPNGPDAERAMAIKVREAVDAVLRGAPLPRGNAVAPNIANITNQPEISKPSLPTRTPTRYAFTGEAGGIATAPLGSPSAQIGGLISIGARMTRARLAIEAYAMAHLVSGATDETADGIIETSELSFGAGARALLVRGRWSFGGFAEIAARSIEARGETALGARGSIRVTVPTARFGVEARLEVRPGIQVRGALGSDISLQRQRFAVNNQVVLDLGRARPIAVLSVVFRVP